MAFIQPCFIKKNNSQLRLALHNLGYENARNDTVGNCIATTTTTQHYNTISQYYVDSNDPRITWKENRIDCETNEELFLALAALRNDTNENQWFIAQRTMWDENYNGEITVYYEENEWLMWDYYSFMEDMPSDFRKATVEEIIEHFNKN